MTPLTKETLEAASSTTESAAPRTAAPAPSSAHLRSDAVSLEIPVKVHGSRITEVVRGVTPHTEPFEEQTTTMIVFAQGGVVKMSTPVTTGQMMVLTNLKTRQDVICRVLKVRNNPNLQSYVEVEFTHPQPGYWGVFFPSDGPEFAPRTASSAQSLNLQPETEKTSQDVSRPFASSPTMQGGAPARPPAAPVVPQTPAPSSYTPPPQKPESAFISIGSQEKVQVAASSTLTPKKAPVLESVKENRAPSVPLNITANTSNVVPIVMPKRTSGSEVAEVPVSSAADISIEDLQGDELSASVNSAASAAAEREHQSQSMGSTESSAASSRSTFGTFGASPAAASSREMFGSSLGVAGPAIAAQGAQPQGNWILIVVCALVAAVAAAGGTMYFYRSHAGNAATNAASAAPSAPPVTTAAVATQNPAAQGSQANQFAPASPAAPANPAPNVAPTNARANTARGSKAIVTDSAPAQAAQSATATLAAGALSAHPVSSRRTNAQTEAPALEAGMISPGTGSALAGIPSSSNALPPPPESPDRVGGVLKGPKLVSSIPPVYPLAAKQAMVDGDVVIHATIDKNGNVTEAQVISGPSILREAALTAVRRWKYAPSMLDGQTISSETTVTVKFRR
jgi:TonB family protein